jgi:tol-pal system protein YbgF
MSIPMHRALSSAAARSRRGGGAALGLALAMALLGAPGVHAQVAGAGASDAVVRTQELEAEVRRLNGLIEELEHRLTRIAEDAALRIGDLEYRVVVLEGGDASVLGASPPLGGAPAVNPAANAPPAVAVSERAAFEAGVAEIRGGRAADGRRSLDAFRRAYPGSPLSGAAQHWIAEALFLTNDYRAAAQTYLSNVTAYEDEPLAPDSLIGLALSLEKLGQPAEACMTLTEAQRRFPAATVANERAVAERARLACQ